ncbi:MAG: Putative Crp family transcriptional regulator [Succiniclasticum sp.]|jgi:CRP/FNR family transcriptional regulator, anaerobic regulatory protein
MIITTAQENRTDPATGVAPRPGDFSDLYIRNFSFWPHLTDAQRSLLNSHTHVVSFSKGSLLFGGSHDCAGVALVKTGRLRAYILSDDGREVTLYSVFPGEVEVLTATCVLKDVTYHVFVEADEDTQVLLTDSATFRTVSEQNIYARCAAYERAAQRLSQMLHALQDVLFVSADKRLIRFLLSESRQSGTDKLKLTQTQIASYMGSVREVVSRLLKDLSAAGLVRSGRGTVTLLDKPALEKLAQ